MLESCAVVQAPSASPFDGMQYAMWVLPVSKLLEMEGPPLHHQQLIEAHSSCLRKWFSLQTSHFCRKKALPTTDRLCCSQLLSFLNVESFEGGSPCPVESGDYHYHHQPSVSWAASSRPSGVLGFFFGFIQLTCSTQALVLLMFV